MRRAAAGWAALLTLVLAGAADAAPVRVLEAEGMKASAGAVVRERGAAAGRALALQPAGIATATVATEAIGSVVIRARSTRCARGRTIVVSVDGGAPHPFTPRTRWRESRARVTLPAGVHTLQVSFAAGAHGKRCRALLDRLRLPAPQPRKVAPGPAAPPTAQPGRYVPLGASVQWQHFAKDMAYGETFRREFVSLTPENEMKMEWLQPERGRWNFEAADKLVDHAVANGKQVRGHTLVFGKQTPVWVDRILFSNEAEAVLREHILTVLARYKGRVGEWDVVNEALDEKGHFRTNAWLQKLGSQYVETAFRFAREADPSAKLFYNEFDADVAGVKRDATVALVKRLKDQGLIDGVGLQLHTSLPLRPSRDALIDTMRLYESIGLEVQVTEMDVLAGGSDALVDRLVLQAGIYRSAAEACATVAACTKLTVWGVNDHYSWMGPEQLPLLFDATGAAKPALSAVREVIGG